MVFPVLVILILLFYLLVFQSRSPEAPSSPSSPDQSLTSPSGRSSVRIDQKSPLESEPGTSASIVSPPGSTPLTNRDTSAGSKESSETDIPSPMTVVNGRPVTEKENFIHPRWSPDGMDVVCTKHNFRGLYLVSSDGSRIRELSDELGIGYDVKWSADGTKLLVKKDGVSMLIDLSGQEVEGSPNERDLLTDRVYAKEENIYIKDPETGEEKILTNGEDNFFDPHISPDGTKVAYQGLASGLHVQNLATGEVIDIGQGSGLQWISDGTGLIYNVTQDDGMNMIAGDIYFAYADGSGIFNITNTPDIIELNPTLSPDGSQVTYEVDGQIFVADIQK